MSTTCCISVLLIEMLVSIFRRHQVRFLYSAAVLGLICFMCCDGEAEVWLQSRVVLISNIGEIKMVKNTKKKGKPCSNKVTPPTLVENNVHGNEGAHPAARGSERDLLEEFKEKMSQLGKDGFFVHWQEAALIIEYEEKLCDLAKDDDGRLKNLRNLEKIYRTEFDLPPTTAQRYKRVYRFFAPHVSSKDAGSPTLETLAEIRMSKLDLLVAVKVRDPFSWSFTDDGYIVFEYSTYSDENRDVRDLEMDTLRKILKEKKEPVVQTDNPLYVDAPGDDESTDNSVIIQTPVTDSPILPLDDPRGVTSNGVNGTTPDRGVPDPTDGTDTTSCLPRYTLNTWDDCEITLSAYEGKIRYDDPGVDSGSSERVFHALNGDIVVNYDDTDNPQFEILPRNQKYAAYAVLREPNDGNGGSQRAFIIYCDPYSDTSRYFQLTTNN